MPLYPDVPTGAFVGPVQSIGSLANTGTDQGSAITSVLNSAVAAGVPVHAPAGTYTASNIVIPSGLVLIGDGAENTIFKLPSSSTNPVFISQNFASLTGGNTNGGVSGVWLQGFAIDGNNAASGGWGLQKYGYRWTIKDVWVRNCKAGGIYGEWCTVPGVGADGGFMEDLLQGLRVYNNTNFGIQWRGPHDTRILSTLIYSNTGVGLSLEGSTTYHAGGIVLDSVHSYGNSGHGIQTTTSAANGANCSCIGTNVISESNGGDGLHIGSHGVLIFSGNFYNDTYGVSVNNNAAGYLVVASCQNNSSAAINFASDSGNALVDLTVYTATAGQATVAGSPNSATEVRIRATGSGTLANEWITPATIQAAGLTVSSGLVWLNGQLRIPQVAASTAGYLWYDSTAAAVEFYSGATNSAQPLQSFITATSTQLGAAAQYPNTVGKFQGLQVFCTTTNRPVWATGSAATATWVYADGTTAYTPA